MSLNPDGSFAYTPAADFNGTDSFSFKANDGALDSNTASVAITVAPVNDAPVLGGDDAISVTDGGTVAVTTADLTASDIDNSDAELVYTVTGDVARHRARRPSSCTPSPGPRTASSGGAAPRRQASRRRISPPTSSRSSTTAAAPPAASPYP